MPGLPDRVRSLIEGHALVPPGSRVLVAVSGGSDSVALFHLLHRVAASVDFTLVGIAHLNHELRGAAADEDAGFCRRLAEDAGLPAVVEAVDVGRLARTMRSSIESAARAARYAFLDRAADHLRADRIAVGHTRDDQAETFVLRLLRGAGPRGLAGIHPRKGRVVRPLLDITRAELRAYLSAHGIPYREDATNADVTIPRNRIRHELLPYVARHLAPKVVDVLARNAAIARDDEAWLRELTDAHAERLIRLEAERVQLDPAALLALPVALGRRVALVALTHHAPRRVVGFGHVDRLLRLAAGEPGRAADFPRQRGHREQDLIVLYPARPSTPARSGYAYGLPVPGEARVVEPAVLVSARQAGLAAVRDLGTLAGRADWAALEADRVATPLVVRSRRPGDRFRPLGMRGRKKLQDVFVDRKIARQERDLVPLVVDAKGRIVWVVGHGVDDDFRVSPGSKGVIVLKASRLGGNA